MAKIPIQIEVEKKYWIDTAGNADVERKWILRNQSLEDIDISGLSLYVIEYVNDLSDVKASDSSGGLEFKEERMGSAIKMKVKPRIEKMNSRLKYEMSLSYHFPSYAHKLGDAWFFSDMISGLDESAFTSIISSKMNLKLQVTLPRLKKRFWQKLFNESSPKGKKEESKPEESGKKMTLTWRNSLSPERNYIIRLIYGVRTHSPIVSMTTAIGTAIIVGLISLAFDFLKGG